MIDFIMGWVLGRNMNKTPNNIEPVEIEPIKPIEEPKVYKYVYLKELDDFDATLEGCYNDYEEVELITIYKNNHIYYFKEVLVPISDEYYGNSKLLDFI